ncbi:MAG: thioredoxin-like domain-containing protein [Bacteroidota bacterium]
MEKSIGNLGIIALVLFCMYSYAQQAKEKVPFEPFTDKAEIEVVMKGSPAGIVRLYGILGNQNVLKDSAMADSTGKAVFKNNKRYEAGLYYAVYGDNTVLGFLMDRNQQFYLHTSKYDLIHEMKTNSAENEIYFSNQVYEADLAGRFMPVTNGLKEAVPGSPEYLSLKERERALVAEKKKVVSEYNEKYPGSFFASFKLMGQNPILKEPKKPNGELDTNAQRISYRNEFWDNYDFNDERMVRTPVFFNKLNSYLNNLYPQQADSLLSGVKFIMEKIDKGNKELFNFTVNYLLITYKQSTVMGGEKIFVYMVDNYFTLKKAYWTDSVNVIRAKMQVDLMRASLLGMTGQDLRCKNEQGEYVNLYSIKKPIRVVFLYNPDCEHCQKETPKLKALYDKWKSKGLEVYALNVEKDYTKWHDYIKKLDLNWINVIDPNYESLYYKKYHIVNTPGLYVLDSNNKIVSKQLMPDQLEPIFESLLK